MTSSQTVSSGTGDSAYGRIATSGKVDVSHGPILYLESVTVSFDGFKALNNLSLTIDAGELILLRMELYQAQHVVDACVLRAR